MKKYAAFSTLDLFDRLRLSTEHPEAPAWLDELERRHILEQEQRRKDRDRIMALEDTITNAHVAYEQARERL